MGNFEVQQQRAPHQVSELHSLPVLSWSRARLHWFPSQHRHLAEALSKLLMFAVSPLRRHAFGLPSPQRLRIFLQVGLKYEALGRYATAFC
jgi:hypothetical protein